MDGTLVPTIAPDAGREQVLATFDVSRETAERLDRFVALLLARQRRTNLISQSTIPTIWTRHVADSLQILRIAPNRSGTKAPVWIDLGSGGGFPGLVLACALAEVPGACVHLIESNLKKAAFLSEAVLETTSPAVVHPVRVETRGATLAPAVDFVTARALAPLPALLDLVEPFLKKGAKALLLKGQDLDHELTEATKHWHIEAESVQSQTSQTGRILVVHALSKHK